MAEVLSYSAKWTTNSSQCNYVIHNFCFSHSVLVGSKWFLWFFVLWPIIYGVSSSTHIHIDFRHIHFDWNKCYLWLSDGRTGFYQPNFDVSKVDRSNEDHIEVDQNHNFLWNIFLVYVNLNEFDAVPSIRNYFDFLTHLAYYVMIT